MTFTRIREEGRRKGDSDRKRNGEKRETESRWERRLRDIEGAEELREREG